LCSGIRSLPLLPKKKSAMLGDTSHTAPKKVLVVEDNELNLKLLKDLLEYQGYRVITTRLGEPALGLARQYKPDLILMDIQLPDNLGNGGYSTPQERRRNPRHPNHCSHRLRDVRR
jgi:CheY-like chemotaxis protein